jgi:caffeoyl-CoA O-methyltransferase
MSEVATMVTTELIRYLAAHTGEEDAFLCSLRQAAAEREIPAIAISPEQGTMIQILLRLMQAEKVLEIGTLYGLSAIVMARALGAAGEVHSLELNTAFAEFAEEWIAKSDVASNIQIHRGNAVEWLPSFGDRSMDAAFIDADKANYQLYLKECKRIVRRGGLVLVDNAFAYGQLFDENPSRKDDVWAIQKFNDLFAHDRDLTSVILPIGDGMWITIID